MVTILTTQLSELRASMDKEREERTKMQEQLFNAKLETLKATLQPAAPPQGFKDQVKELAELFGIQPAEVFKRFSGTSDGPPIKSRMSGTLEFLSEVLPKIVDSPLAGAIATRLTQPPQPPPGQPQTINVQPQPQTPNPQQDLFRFVNEHITGPLIEFLRVENSGAEFAQWVYNGFPLEQLEALQSVEHPLMPGMKGAPVIIELYKRASNGAIWRDHLQSREPQFKAFVEEFCAWKPPEDTEEQTPEEGKPIDLDAQGNNA